MTVQQVIDDVFAVSLLLAAGGAAIAIKKGAIELITGGPIEVHAGMKVFESGAASA
jgi:uncharacterized protein (DUF2345 family)